MLQAADLTIRLNPADDVVIARVELPASTEIIKEKIRTAVTIPAGHKIATHDIGEGSPVRRYNQIIGFAVKPIKAGQPLTAENIRVAEHRRRTRGRPCPGVEGVRLDHQQDRDPARPVDVRASMGGRHARW